MNNPEINFQNDPNKIGVFSAWPYANGPRHLGHGASLIVADVVARYHRSLGDDVLMVSGTDEHGTPNLLAAERAQQQPIDYVTQMSKIIQQDFIDIGMSFDRFSRTTAPEHKQVVQDIFRDLFDKEYITAGEMLGSFDVETDQSLPDRYVEGNCPNCSEHSRGDQCESCSTMLDPNELIDPVSSLTGNPVVFRNTAHYFLQLDKLAPEVDDWLRSGDNNLRPNAINISLEMVKDMKPRAITRDMSWGVPLPEGFELNGDNEKVLYVWFEAVIGYLSASMQWANQKGDSEAWKDWWQNPNAYHYYAMGKDNVPFHTLVWPSILFGLNEDSAEKYNLPDAIASTEYLTFKDGKFSSSRGNTLYLGDMVELVGPDALRYFLISAGPETSDKEFSFEELVSRTNNELINNWGNLVNRVVNMTAKSMSGEIPNDIRIESLQPEDLDVLKAIELAFSVVGDHISKTKFRKALQTAMEASSIVNKYLYVHEPWKKFNTAEENRAREIMYVAQVAVSNLSVMLSPFMPHSSQRVQELLNQDTKLLGEIAQNETTDEGFSYTYIHGNYSDTKSHWHFSLPTPKDQIKKPKPLFAKLDAELIYDDFNSIASKRSIGRIAIQ